jgi:hypothetical protein
MTNEVLQLLASFSKRLATLADHAHETREQAQHTLDRIYLLRQDVEKLRKQILIDFDSEAPVPSRSDMRR